MRTFDQVQSDEPGLQASQTDVSTQMQDMTAEFTKLYEHHERNMTRLEDSMVGQLHRNLEVGFETGMYDLVGRMEQIADTGLRSYEDKMDKQLISAVEELPKLLYQEIQDSMAETLKQIVKDNVREDLIEEIRGGVKAELREELKQEIKSQVRVTFEEEKSKDSLASKTWATLREVEWADKSKALSETLEKKLQSIPNEYVKYLFLGCLLVFMLDRVASLLYS